MEDDVKTGRGNARAARGYLFCSVAACTLLSLNVAQAADDANPVVSPDAVETVTVIGKATYVSPSYAPVDVIQPTSVVQAGFIKDNIIPLASFDDIIKFEPSVFDQSPNGPGLGKSETLSIRGFQDGQYNVTFDGIPFGDATDLHHTSSALFIAHDLAEAEVDRGPGGASTIGKATFGGTVGFRTKTAQDNFSFDPYATYGSFDTAAGGLEINSGDTGFGQGFVDYQQETTDGYLTYSGEHRINAMGKWDWKLNDTTTLTILGTVNHEFQYTTQGATLANIQQYGRNFALCNNPQEQCYYAYNPSNYYSDFYYGDFKTILFSRLSIDDKVYTDYFAHDYQEGKDATDTNPADNKVTYYTAGSYPAGNSPKDKSKTSLSSDIPGKAANARFRAWGNILRADYDTGVGDIIAGLWFDEQHDRRYSGTIDWSQGGAWVPGKYGTPYSYDYKDVSKTAQPFAEFDWNVTDQLTLTPGVKYTYFSRSVEGPVNKGTSGPIDYGQKWGSLQPSISARYAFDDSWSAYAQAARGFLAPPVDVFQVTTPGTLKPETTWNYQIGTTMRRDRFTIGADAYYIAFSNFFSTIPVPGDPSDTTYVNGGGAVYKGIEFEGQYALGGGFSTYGNYTINAATYNGTGVTIAESPAYTASLGVMYDDQQGPYASLIGKLIGPRYGDDGNALDPTTEKLVAADTFRFGSTFTADLAAGYRFSPVSNMDNGFTISLKVGNILNNRQLVDYGGTQSATSAQYPNGAPIYWTVAGRNVFLNLSASLF